MCVRLYGGIAAASSASVHGARCCTCTHAPLFTLHTSQRADGGVRVARGAVRARGVLEAVDAEFNAARVRALPCEGLHDLDVVPDRQRRLRPLHTRQPARCSPPLPTRRSARPHTRRQAPEGREGGEASGSAEPRRAARGRHAGLPHRARGPRASARSTRGTVVGPTSRGSHPRYAYRPPRAAQRA